VATTPAAGTCEHCQQTRPLVRYEPDHNFHFAGATCEWCERETQPLLCTPCWGRERQREDDAPMGAEEKAMTEALLGLRSS
jgi:hypothetical protein